MHIFKFKYYIIVPKFCFRGRKMKKKILAICITGMFIIVGVTGVTALTVTKKNINKPERNENEKLNTYDFGGSEISIGYPHLYQYLNVYSNNIYPSGDYLCKLTVDFGEPWEPADEVKGYWWARAEFGGKEFYDFQNQEFHYFKSSVPDDIYIEEVLYIPPGVTFAEISCGFIFDDYLLGDPLNHWHEWDLDSASNVIIPRTRNANVFLLQFLEQNLILFPILRYLLGFQ